MASTLAGLDRATGAQVDAQVSGRPRAGPSSGRGSAEQRKLAANNDTGLGSQEFRQKQAAAASTQTKELCELSAKVAQQTFEAMNSAFTKTFDQLKKVG